MIIFSWFIGDYKLCNQLEEVSQCTFQKALLVFYLNDICCLSELFLSLHLWPLVTHSIKWGQQISEISFSLTQRNQFRFQVILLSVHLWQLARSQCELTFISVLSVRTSCVPLSTVRLASSVQFIPHGFLANIIKCTSGKNSKFFLKYKSSKTRGRWLLLWSIWPEWPLSRKMWSHKTFFWTPLKLFFQESKNNRVYSLFSVMLLQNQICGLYKSYNTLETVL